MDAITSTNFKFPNQKSYYKGKVREVYNINDEILVMIVSDRISAFDVVLPRGIPYKGQVLNQIASKFLKATSDIVPNWVIDSPDPMVTVGRMCEPFKVEMVIRGYLSGHAWRTYKSGKRELCGVKLPEGMKENDKFPEPIITPSTKASVGHDEDISREEILKRGIVSKEDYGQLEKYTRGVFQRGTELADKMGLILVDTKYEFGKAQAPPRPSPLGRENISSPNGGGQEGAAIYLIDEIHTPDSSRYFYKEGYAERQAKGEAQKQLSKEFVREWLIANNFMGKDGQKVPEMTDEVVKQISDRYIELYENILGEKFQRTDASNVLNRVEANINLFLKKYSDSKQTVHS